MQVAKWGSSLAIRLPASVVEALQLKAGDEIEFMSLTTGLSASRATEAASVRSRIRAFRKELPPD